MKEYKLTRNGLKGPDYSTKFSPWLALGCLSPRFIHAEVHRYEKERVANDSTYWSVPPPPGTPGTPGRVEQ